MEMSVSEHAIMESYRESAGRTDKSGRNTIRAAFTEDDIADIADLLKENAGKPEPSEKRPGFDAVKAMELYNQGASDAKIAEAVGRSHENIRQWRKKNGLANNGRRKVKSETTDSISKLARTASKAETRKSVKKMENSKRNSGAAARKEAPECLAEKTGAPDNICRPSHYTQGSVEVIDAIAGIIPDYASYLQGNVIKYISRYRYKNGAEDLRKAEQYLQRLIREAEERAANE